MISVLQIVDRKIIINCKYDNWRTFNCLSHFLDIKDVNNVLCLNNRWQLIWKRFSKHTNINRLGDKNDHIFRIEIILYNNKYKFSNYEENIKKFKCVIIKHIKDDKIHFFFKFWSFKITHKIYLFFEVFLKI